MWIVDAETGLGAPLVHLPFYHFFVSLAAEGGPRVTFWEGGSTMRRHDLAGPGREPPVLLVLRRCQLAPA